MARWAADCAAEVLPIFETASAGDPRVRSAIDQAWAFASGELAVRDAIRCRGGQAGAAARDAPNPAARAAAYAAEQAAAVAHMGAHALGAAGYAARATVLASTRQGDDIVSACAHRQVAMMTDSIVGALSLLPELGTNASGPLGPGRLSSGEVGRAIRAIQAELRQRAARRSTR